VRADLPPGQQATQAVHGAFSFAHEHPKLADDWYEQSKWLVLLQVADEQELVWWHNRLLAAECVIQGWEEPDLGNELTAVAVAPSETARRMLAQLPLLLREPAMT
jgi:peptidyl-tRNA hydrolase